MVKIDRELEQMEAVVCRMGRKVALMHEKVLVLLQKNNKELALEIIQGDDFINHMEEEINDLAVNALALLSPVASDLRRVIAGIKVASELERIADYAKGNAVFLIKHDDLNHSVMDTCEQMEMQMLNMLSITMSAYEKKDSEAAFEIPEMDNEIDALFLELRQSIQNSNDILLCKHVFELSTMIHNIERSGDHIINICEHIIYMVKGQHYDFG